MQDHQDNNQYEVYYQDGLKPDVSVETAIKNICDLFKVSPAKAENMIQSTNRVIKTGLSKEKVEQYVVALDRAGMKVEIRKNQPDLGAPHQTESNQAEPDQVEADQVKPSKTSSIETQLTAVPASAPVQENNIRQAKAVSGERIIGVNFNGRGFEYFKIWIVNIFLTIVTLGIYSAWAKVRNKQYFYGNTEIDGSSFNYTANPVAILKGRLIAVVFFLLYAVVNQVMPILGLVFFIILMAFLPWIVVRSLAFNARNSVYRNIPFNFTGEKADATKVFLLWPILIIFTIGLILPFIWYKQRYFIVNNSAYGTTSFSFHATAKDFYRIFFVAFGVLILGVIISALIFVFIPSLMVLSGPLGIAIYLFMFSYLAAALGNLNLNSTSLLDHGFNSQLQTKNIAWLYFTNTLAITLTLGLFIPWAQVRMASYRAQCIHLLIQGSLDEFIAAEQKNISALGEQVGEVFDMDISVV